MLWIRCSILYDTQVIGSLCSLEGSLQYFGMAVMIGPWLCPHWCQLTKFHQVGHWDDGHCGLTLGKQLLTNVKHFIGQLK